MVGGEAVGPIGLRGRVTAAGRRRSGGGSPPAQNRVRHQDGETRRARCVSYARTPQAVSGRCYQSIEDGVKKHAPLFVLSLIGC